MFCRAFFISGLMLKVSRHHEEAFLVRASSALDVCENRESCVGLLHLNAFALTRFQTSEKRYERCILCLRADATRKWMQACLNHGANEVVHDWVVDVREYDERCCLRALGDNSNAKTASTFLGVLGPFPRYFAGDFVQVSDVQLTQKTCNQPKYCFVTGDLVFKAISPTEIAFQILCSQLVCPGACDAPEGSIARQINAAFFSKQASNRQMVSEVVAACPLLSEFIREIHGSSWDEDVINPVPVNFWDRMYEKNTKKVVTTPFHSARGREGIVLLQQMYKRNHQSAKIVPSLVSDTCAVLRKRHRLHANRAVRLPPPMRSAIKYTYACETCEVMKCKFVKYTTTDPIRQNSLKGGAEGVFRDMWSGDVICYRRRSGGRKAELLHYEKHQGRFKCESVCSRRDCGRFVQHVRNIAYVMCRRCGNVCQYTNTWIMCDNLCAECKDPAAMSICCFICGNDKKANSKSLNWTFVDTIVDGGQRPTQRLWFCRREVKYIARLKMATIWSAPLLRKCIQYHW